MDELPSPRWVTPGRIMEEGRLLLAFFVGFVLVGVFVTHPHSSATPPASSSIPMDIFQPFVGSYVIKIPEPSYWLTFMPSGIKVNTETGEVSIPENINITEAAKHFWNSVALVRGVTSPFPDLIKK